MFLAGHDDEDNDFNIGGGGSKLANLFTSEQIKGEESKQSLTYTAPKQPKKTDGQASASVSVLHAVAVHTFKLENQQYVAQGKLGAAILGNHESCTYQLLLYKGQQQHVAMASITPALLYNVQPSNYSNFYDNKRECWSIRFDTEAAGVEFAKQVAIAKANSNGGPAGVTKLVVQDLLPGEEEPLDTGHMAEVRYTGWLLTNRGLGHMFDTNFSTQTPLRLKLGKGKVIKGWEEGLLGAKKGGRRLLVVPPALGYGEQGAGDKIPPNSTLVFELLVVKTKRSRDSRSSTPVASQSGGEESRLTSTPYQVSAPQPIGNQNDESVKARGASISEQLSQSPKTEKALLISRMAKMGMPMLPMQQTQPSSESENEDEVASKSRGMGSRTASPKPTLKPRPAPITPSAHVEQPMAHPTPTVMPLTPSQQQHQQVALLQQQSFGMLGQENTFSLSQAYPYQYNAQASMPMFPQASAPPPVSTDSAHWPLLLSESRTQNSEVRITLGKISDRVDMVLSKLSDARNHVAQDPGSYMESSILMQNIQRIIQENNKLKSEAEDKNSKIIALNEKICDLLQKNQKLVEDSNHLLEKRSDTFHSSSSQSQARLITLEEDKSKLTAELSDALSKVTELQLALQRKQAQQLTKGDELNIQLEEQENMITGLQQNLRSLRNDKKELISKIDTLQDQMQDLQSSKHALEKTVERTQRKLSDEKRRAQEEMEDIRGSLTDEVDSLRLKLEKQKSSPTDLTDVESLESCWREEKETLVKDINKMKSSVLAANELKEDLECQINDLQNKLDSARKSRRDSCVSELEEQVATLSIWKSKYDALLKSSEIMRLQYEGRLKGAERNNSSMQDLVEPQLKKAMNALYRGLQRDFQLDETYSGSQALQLTLNMIKLVTLTMVEESRAILQESKEADSEVSEPSSRLTSEENPTDDQLLVPQNTSKTELSQHTSSDVPDEEDPQVNNLKISAEQNGISSDDPKVDDKEISGIQIPSENMKSEESDDFRRAKPPPLCSPDSLDDPNKTYVFFDKKSKSWKPQPPPPPLFDDDDDEEDEDDWLK